ncbi:hypothetical protein GCM10027514_35170 [Azotobacter armeniacus]
MVVTGGPDRKAEMARSLAGAAGPTGTPVWIPPFRGRHPARVGSVGGYVWGMTMLLSEIHCVCSVRNGGTGAHSLWSKGTSRGKSSKRLPCPGADPGSSCFCAGESRQATLGP